MLIATIGFRVVIKIQQLHVLYNPVQMLQIQQQQMQHVEYLEKDVLQMEQDVLSQLLLVQVIKELKQLVMDLLETVYHALIIQQQLQEMLV